MPRTRLRQTVNITATLAHIGSSQIMNFQDFMQSLNMSNNCANQEVSRNYEDPILSNRKLSVRNNSLILFYKYRGYRQEQTTTIRGWSPTTLTSLNSNTRLYTTDNNSFYVTNDGAIHTIGATGDEYSSYNTYNTYD